MVCTRFLSSDKGRWPGPERSHPERALSLPAGSGALSRGVPSLGTGRFSHTHLHTLSRLTRYSPSLRAGCYIRSAAVMGGLQVRLQLQE